MTQAPRPPNTRNQTSTAQRKLERLAAVNGVDFHLVATLAETTYDYDPGAGNEPRRWVDATAITDAAKKRLAEQLGLPVPFRLTFDQAVEEIAQALAARSGESMWEKFHGAVPNGNYSILSEFASHQYLRGFDRARAAALAWSNEPIGVLEIARHLFLKLFRGGAIERHELAYLWCDLAFSLHQRSPEKPANERWLETLLDSVEALPPRAGLGALLKCCRGLVGGDKYFKQESLQALAYADVLRVNELPVTTLFLAERRHERSPHFHSNDWSFPLKFWPRNGGTVCRRTIARPHPRSS